MVKSTATDCCHLIKRRVIVYSDVKIEGSNRTKLAPMLITEFNSNANRTSDSSFQKKNGAPNSLELNPMNYFIWSKIFSHMECGKIKTINDLRRAIEKAIKKIDTYYILEAIGVLSGKI